MSPSIDPSRTALWVLRGAWLVIPLVVGRGIITALAATDEAMRSTVEVGLWASWFVGLEAVLAPSTISLTVVRTLAAGAPVSALLAGALGAFTTASLLAVAAGILLAGICFLPHAGAPMINGSAYGSERRMALRPPAAVLMGPIQIAWVLVYAGLITGPLLLAGGRWFPGTIGVVLGFPLAALGARSLHQLSRRWLVFVPAGFVIHDYDTLAESVLILRRTKPHLSALDRASGENDLLELSRGAMGLPLVVEVDEALPVALRQGRSIETRSAERIVFSPTLPGAALAEARLRAINVG